MDRMAEEGREWWWIRDYGHRDTDLAVEPFLPIEATSPWLKRAREALFLSAGSVARRMGILRSAYARLEKSEADGVLTIRALKYAAKAMDCELVYAIRPRRRCRFSRIVGEPLWEVVQNHPSLRSGGRADLRAAARMRDLMYDPKFRERQGWGRNTTAAARDRRALLRRMGRGRN